MEIIGDYLYTNDPHVNIYTKGDFQDYQFITLDKGIPEGSRFKYPIKKIKLILPTEYERSQQLPKSSRKRYLW